MTVHLRPADPRDADAVAQVYLRSRKELVACAPLAHSDDDVRAWIRDTLIPRGGVHVAEVDGAIVGFVALSRGVDERWIDQLYVSPPFVGAGVGARLLALARQTLPPPIRLYTFQANARARRFYERQGFRVVAVGDGSGNEEGCADLLLEWSPEYTVAMPPAWTRVAPPLEDPRPPSGRRTTEVDVADQTSTDREAIDRLHRRDMIASMAGDYATLRALMSDDAAVMPPGGRLIHGREALDASYRRMQEGMGRVKVLEYVLDFQEVLVLGDHAVEWGAIRGAMAVEGQAEPERSTFKVMRVLKRQPDGEWKVHRTIWNADPPTST